MVYGKWLDEGMAPGVVCYCCGCTASGFDELCVQKCSCPKLGCNKLLFDLLLLFYQNEPIWPFSNHFWHQQGIFSHGTAAHWTYPCFWAIFLKQRSVWMKIPANQQFRKTEIDQPVWHSLLSDVHRHLNQT